ncbi:LuxR C-terminal-related transcriptional regulator [Streptomyces coryli]|uniref:LuxR C-terminal-related transcriptional regulator n=1 Tax=Streptomyces coryli TaxID=1128680 RepID=UPI0030B90511
MEIAPAFPTLVSKITVPPKPTWLVSRPQLVSRLTRGVHGPLTVIVGPVGAGKSALALEWAHTGTAQGPLAWVSCYGSEEPPGIFWTCVVEALCRAGVDTAWLGTLSPDSADFVPGFVARLTADLAARDEPVTLVLDDFQPAARSPTAEGMAYLLQHAGPALRLMVTSRRDPPLPLHRLRLAGELTEIRTEDLAFSESETQALLAQHDVSLPRTAIGALTRRTEGWAAGLRLAAMSMVEHPYPERFVAQFAGDDEAVVSYLVEEVLDAQKSDMRQLLLTTSLPEQVNAELAAELAGEATAGHFAALVENNSFLQSLGHGWYRCHQMFRDVLRLRLRHEAPDQVIELHRRAATWFGGRDHMVEAVSHAAAAGDWQYMSSLVIHRLAVGHVLGLTGGQLTEVFKHIPTDVLAAAPDGAEPELMLVASASALARGEHRLSAEALTQAGELLADDDSSPGRTAEAKLTHAVIRLQSERNRGTPDALRAAAEAKRLFRLIPSGVLADRPELRALVLSAHGDGELRSGHLNAAQTTLGKALRAAIAAGNSELRHDCLIGLALIEALRGRFREASELVAQAELLSVVPRAATAGSSAPAHVLRGWVHLARGRPTEAREELSVAGAALRTAPDPFVSGLRSLVDFLTGIAEGRPLPDPQAVAQAGGDLPAPWLVELFESEVARARATPVRHAPAPTPAGAAGRAAASPERHPGPRVTERLSKRELEVLVNLSQMMTTEEIAAQLYLSANTVKTHLKSVYRKLGVSQRTAAVRRARELKLL